MKEEGYVPSLELRTEVLKFVQEKLQTRNVLTLSELRRLLSLKLAQSEPGHVLGMGISDTLLAETVKEAGGTSLRIQVRNG